MSKAELKFVPLLRAAAFLHLRTAASYAIFIIIINIYIISYRRLPFYHFRVIFL